MKKLLCVVLVLMLALSGIGFADEDTSFTPKLANSMDWSVDTWFSTSTNRALLTVLLLLEASTDSVTGQSDILNVMKYRSFVGKSEGVLIVGGVFDGYDVAITYNPSSGKAFYLIESSSLGVDAGAAKMKDLVAGACEDGSYENDQGEIASVLEKVVDALKSLS